MAGPACRATRLARRRGAVDPRPVAAFANRGRAAPRRDGAWGVYAHPFGYGAILDVFAAVLHSLSDFQEHIVTTAAEGVVSVNLHFDTDTAAVAVRSTRDAQATLTVTPKQNCGLRIRVPGWASRDSVRLSVADKPAPLKWDGAYLTLSKKDLSGREIVLLQH